MQGKQKFKNIFKIYSVLDLVRKRKLYQILSLIIIFLDLICYCLAETLDICFTNESDDYYKKRSLFILKVIIF